MSLTGDQSLHKSQSQKAITVVSFSEALFLKVLVETWDVWRQTDLLLHVNVCHFSLRGYGSAERKTFCLVFLALALQVFLGHTGRAQAGMSGWW